MTDLSAYSYPPTGCSGRARAICAEDNSSVSDSICSLQSGRVLILYTASVQQ